MRERRSGRRLAADLHARQRQSARAAGRAPRANARALRAVACSGARQHDELPRRVRGHLRSSVARRLRRGASSWSDPLSTRAGSIGLASRHSRPVRDCVAAFAVPKGGRCTRCRPAGPARFRHGAGGVAPRDLRWQGRTEPDSGRSRRGLRQTPGYKVRRHFTHGMRARYRGIDPTDSLSSHESGDGVRSPANAREAR